ncbi:MAG TPA: flap endonuclease-1 [Candidatus Bathyarchaeota archaeon]|nr:flap endonuclease-1 [Candidatus Bathyarchaeota archaeon]
MGVNLRVLIPKAKVDFRSLSGKSVAIDAYNALYQFLAIIRQPDGTPLKDRSGRITSHLSGLLYRTANLVEMGIKVAYVFDGVPPALKEVEIKRRAKVKAEALVKYERALQEGKMEEARSYAQMTSKLKDYMAEDSKRLLTELGVPWVQAPSEGEAQAAYLTRKGATDYCGSQDYDSLLFGATALVRNVTISGRRKIPRKNVYVEVVPEIIKLDQVLKELEVTREQLIDIAILVGTDFNPDGVKGIGPKTALKLIKKHGSVEDALTELEDAELPAEPKRIREIFLNPKVTDNYKLEWKAPNIDGVVEFLCRERDFSEDRVRKALDKMTAGIKEAKSKTTLESWFG